MMEFQKENTDCNIINNNISYNKVSQSLIKPRNPKPNNIIITATTNQTPLTILNTKSIINTPSLVEKESEIINKDEILDDNSMSDSIDYLSNLSIEEVLQAFRNDAKATEKALTKACITDNNSQCKILPGQFRDYISAFHSPESVKKNIPNLLLHNKIPVLITTSFKNKNIVNMTLSTTSKSKLLNILERADSPNAISSPTHISNTKQPLSTTLAPLVSTCIFKSDHVIDNESQEENPCMTRKKLSRTPPKNITKTVNEVINNEVDINLEIVEQPIIIPTVSNKVIRSPIQLSSSMISPLSVQNETPILPLEKSKSNIPTSVPFIAKKALARTPPKPTFEVEVNKSDEINIEIISNNSELLNTAQCLSKVNNDKYMIVLGKQNQIVTDIIENNMNDSSSPILTPIISTNDVAVKESINTEEFQESNLPIIESWTMKELEIASSAIRRVSIDGRRRSLELSSNTMTDKVEEIFNNNNNNNNIETIEFFQNEIIRLRNELIAKEKQREEEKNLIFQRLGGVEERIANVLLESFKKKEEDLLKVMTISIPLSKIEDEILLTNKSISEIDESINKLEIRKNDRKIRLKAMQESVEKKKKIFESNIEKRNDLKENEIKENNSNTSCDLSKNFFSPSQNPPLITDSHKFIPSENSQFHVPKAIKKAFPSLINIPVIVPVEKVDNIEFDEDDNGGGQDFYNNPCDDEFVDNDISDEIIKTKTPIIAIEEIKSVKNIISKKTAKSYLLLDSTYKSTEKTSYNKYGSNMTFVPLEREKSKKKSILMQNMAHTLDNEIDNENISIKINNGNRKIEIKDTKKKQCSVSKKLEMNVELNDDNKISDVINNIELEVNIDESNKESSMVSNLKSKSNKQKLSSSLTFVPVVKKTKKIKEIIAIIPEVEPVVTLVEEITSNDKISKKKSKKSMVEPIVEPIVESLVEPIVEIKEKKNSKKSKKAIEVVVEKTVLETNDKISNKKSKELIVEKLTAEIPILIEEPVVKTNEKVSKSSKKSIIDQIKTKSNTNIKEVSITKSRPPTAYSLFCTETRSKLKELNPKYSMIEIVKQVNKLWKETSIEDREIWITKTKNIEEKNIEENLEKVINEIEIIGEIVSLKRSNEIVNSNSEILSEKPLSKKIKNEVQKNEIVIVNDTKLITEKNDHEVVSDDDDADCESLFDNYNKSKKEKKKKKSKEVIKNKIKKSNKIIISSPSKERNNDLFNVPLSISPVLASPNDNIDFNERYTELILSPINKAIEKRKIEDNDEMINNKKIKNNKIIKENENFAIPVGKIQKSTYNNVNNISISGKINISSNSIHDSSISSIASVMSVSSKGSKKFVIPKLKKR